MPDGNYLLAKRVFTFSGIYGLLALLPQYFLEDYNGREFPPAITHPEYFYGFIGVAVAWQVAFLIIGRDPVRYRPLMLAAILEKASFGVAVIVLYWINRVGQFTLGAAIFDLVLGALFLLAYVSTRGAAPSTEDAPASSRRTDSSH